MSKDSNSGFDEKLRIIPSASEFRRFLHTNPQRVLESYFALKKAHEKDRAEIEDLKTSLDGALNRLTKTMMHWDQAKSRIAELEELVRYILDNRGKCFIPEDDVNWTERATKALEGE